MARIKKELVAQRESEVVEMFTKGASPKEANEALFTKYGKRMGLERLYALRAGVRAQLAAAQAAEVATAEVVVEAPAAETPAA